MPQWNEIQTKAKKLIDEGLTLLRAGASDASFIAGKTTDAAKLHIDAKKNQLELYRTLYKLGSFIYEKAAKNLTGRSIEITEPMQTLIDKARKLNESTTEDKKKLGKFSVVQKVGKVNIAIKNDRGKKTK